MRVKRVDKVYICKPFYVQGYRKLAAAFQGVRPNRDPENRTHTVCDMGGYLYCDLAGFLDSYLLLIVRPGRIRPFAFLIFAFCGH